MRLALAACLALICASAHAGVPSGVNLVGPVTAGHAICGIGGQNFQDCGLPISGANVINVGNLGLKCDNSTDNAQVFAAIHSLTNEHPGYYVYFPPEASSCLTSAFLTLDAGTTYWAAPNTITIKARSNNVGTVLLAATTAGASNIYVHGLTFDGALSSGQTNNANVVQAFIGDNIVFDTITVQNTRGAGVLFSYNAGGPVTNSGVRNSYFNNVGNFWTFSSVASDRRQGLVFTASGGLSSATGNFSVNNHFTNTGLDAISIANQSDFLASGNHCLNTSPQFATLTSTQYPACVFANNSNNLTISDNTSVGAYGSAFDINGTNPSTFGYGDKLSNNTAIGSGSAGISVNGLTGASLTGNHLWNNVQWSGSLLQGGITLGGNITDITISDSIIEDNQGSPTQVYGIQYVTLVGPIAPNVVNAQIGRSNIIKNNKTAQFNGGAAYTLSATLQVGTLYNGSGASAIPSCVTALAASWASISDGKTSPTYNSAYAAADGSATRPVYCDGTGWTYH